MNFVKQIQYAKTNMDSAKEKLGETVDAAQNKISSTWKEIQAENPDLPDVRTVNSIYKTCLSRLELFIS